MIHENRILRKSPSLVEIALLKQQADALKGVDRNLYWKARVEFLNAQAQWYVASGRRWPDERA